MNTRIVSALLLIGAGSTAAAQPTSHVSPDLQPATVGIMLAFEHKPGPAFLKHLQQDVAKIFQPSGLELRWEVLDGAQAPGAYTRAIIANVRGRCDATELRGAKPPGESLLSLGSTTINDGEVAPFVTLNCHHIARAVAGMSFQMVSRQFLPGVYRRAASLVLAHELMHALLRRMDHDAGDCTRSPLFTEDLMREPQLTSADLAALKEIGRRSGRALAQR